MYPLLHGLEKEGYLEAYDGKAESNRPRRYYKLTKQGGLHLREKKKEWSLFSKTVNTVIGGVEIG